MVVMPRDGALTFRDIAGKLAVLRITCDKCGRSGQYRVDRLIMRYGIDAKLFDWSDEITPDCPRKQAKNLSDMCGRDAQICRRWCQGKHCAWGRFPHVQWEPWSGGRYLFCSADHTSRTIPLLSRSRS
jgi:hypothetical protein